MATMTWVSCGDHLEMSQGGPVDMEVTPLWYSVGNPSSPICTLYYHGGLRDSMNIGVINNEKMHSAIHQIEDRHVLNPQSIYAPVPE